MITSFPTSVNNEETEKFTVKRKDPIYEGDDDNESNGSDYDTDDEYACIDDWDDIVSPDHVSHDKSCENSFDLSLPAFCSHGDVAVEKGKQPLIDLSFDDADGSYEETTHQAEGGQNNESTDDNNNSYLLPDVKKDCEEKELLPKVKRRKTTDNEYSHSDDANSSDHLSLSIQSPVTVIDLTQTSSSSNCSSSLLSSRDSMTPDSVIFTGITIDYYESSNESSNDHEITNADTAVRILKSVTPPPISVRSVTPPPISLTGTTPSPVSPHLRENSATPLPISLTSTTPSPVSPHSRENSVTPSPVSPHLRETSPSLLLPTPEKSIRSIELLGKKRAFEFI